MKSEEKSIKISVSKTLKMGLLERKNVYFISLHPNQKRVCALKIIKSQSSFTNHKCINNIYCSYVQTAIKWIT